VDKKKTKKGHKKKKKSLRGAHASAKGKRLCARRDVRTTRYRYSELKIEKTPTSRTERGLIEKSGE